MKRKLFLIKLFIIVIICAFCLVACDETANGNRNHIHVFVEEIVQPTCTEKGYTKHICSCGDSYNDSLVEELGHQIAEIINKKEPTYKEKGYSGDIYCKICNKLIEQGNDLEILQPLSAEEIYKICNPSVCLVFINGEDFVASGTGFFISNDGVCVTNYHVIDEGIKGNIINSNGDVFNIRAVLGYNKEKDIAILSTDYQNSLPIGIDYNYDIIVGETVYAIGYPLALDLGYQDSTFTSGMISKQSFKIGEQDYIQSTVNITHGNSGGALINKYGKIIGITTSGLKTNEVDYMNLSIPIDQIKSISTEKAMSLEEVNQKENLVYLSFYNGNELLERVAYYKGEYPKPLAFDPNNGQELAYWADSQSLDNKFYFNNIIETNTSVYAKLIKPRLLLAQEYADFFTKNGEMVVKEESIDKNTTIKDIVSVWLDGNVVNISKKRVYASNSMLSQDTTYKYESSSIINCSFIVGDIFNTFSISEAFEIIISESKGSYNSYKTFGVLFKANNIRFENGLFLKFDSDYVRHDNFSLYNTNSEEANAIESAKTSINNAGFYLVLELMSSINEANIVDGIYILM